MAKKTKKNTVVKKAVKASKPVNKKTAVKAKTKSAKPVAAKKKNSAPKKAAKPAPAKKNGSKVKPAAKKGNAKTIVKKAAKKAVKNIKAAVKTVKAAAKKNVKPVKKSAPAKVQKPIASKPAPVKKQEKPVKPAPVAKAAPAKKDVAQKPEAKKTEAAPKAEAKMNGKSALPKAETRKPEPQAGAPVRRKKPESRPAPEFNEDGTPMKMVKLNGKSKHPEPSRIISAPVVAPKPVVVQAEKKKEPKGKFEMEYVIHASSELLFEFLTTPSGLSEWFADDVNIRQGIYTFFWDGAEQQAKLIGYREPKLARFQWADKSDGSYFEFRIEVDELTRDVSLIITDFAEDPAEQHTSKLLWDSQVNKLMHVIGAYY